jgi:putative transposase
MENILAHKIELDPTDLQKQYFMKACGIARKAWNWGLAEWDRQYKLGEKPNQLKLRRQLNSIKGIDFPYMEEVTKTAPQYALMDLGKAFDRFFKKQSNRPCFKKKGKHDSFRADDGPKDKVSDAVKIEGFRVKLPIIGWVKLKEKLRFNGRVLSCVVSRTADRWFASFQVENPNIKPVKVKTKPSIGVDLGIKSLAVLSDGTVFENPKALGKKLKKLKHLQQDLARKQKGSNRRNRARMKVAKLYYRISCIRKDVLHKLTWYLVNNFDRIAIEDLNVKGMVKNRKLAKAISDVSFGTFRRQLGYKCKIYGRELVLVDRFFPSSKTCNVCGSINNDLTLANREWNCTSCGSHLDRDTNAAININNNAVSSPVLARGADVSLGTLNLADRDEARIKTPKVPMVVFGSI